MKEEGSTPADAKEAVFVTSQAVPEDAPRVQGLDFNRHHASNISVVDMVESMSHMGFQASALGDAVRIINGMVGVIHLTSRRTRRSWPSDRRSLCVANMEAYRDWCQDHDLPGVYIESRLIWTPRDSTLPGTTWSCRRDRYYSRWHRGGSD